MQFRHTLIYAFFVCILAMLFQSCSGFQNGHSSTSSSPSTSSSTSSTTGTTGTTTTSTNSGISLKFLSDNTKLPILAALVVPDDVQLNINNCIYSLNNDLGPSGNGLTVDWG